MPRTALVVATLIAVLAASPLLAGGRRNPHVDPTLVRDGCEACHAGHGKSKSPMLGAPQEATCLRCHGGVALNPAEDLAPDARPAQIGPLTGRMAVHPIDDKAFSSGDSNAVVCTSCHSPHRSNVEVRPDKPNGDRYRAPKDPSLFENDLCLRCHGRLSRSDIGSRTTSTNRSYHPISAPSPEKSMSVEAALSGKMINCTDCHGSNDPAGPRGPHASDVRGLLKKLYRQEDGAPESKSSFELCYGCHDRDVVLTRSTFPLHAKHVVEHRIACSTCHDPHGALATRAMVRVAEGDRPGITPSVKTGRLAFISDSPASGSCYLNCHGVEHGPETYGAAGVQQRVRSAARALPPPVTGIVSQPEPRDPRRGDDVRERRPDRP